MQIKLYGIWDLFWNNKTSGCSGGRDKTRLARSWNFFKMDDECMGFIGLLSVLLYILKFLIIKGSVNNALKTFSHKLKNSRLLSLVEWMELYDLANVQLWFYQRRDRLGAGTPAGNTSRGRVVTQVGRLGVLYSDTAGWGCEETDLGELTVEAGQAGDRCLRQVVKLNGGIIWENIKAVPVQETWLGGINPEKSRA